VTSNCHPGRTHEEDEAEETSKSESTEPGVRGEKEEDQNY
jgi:hypothetical protein